VHAFWRQWRQNGAMPSMQIKDVPEEVHAVWRRRAAEAHQSLQEYLLKHVTDEASRPTLAESFARIEAHEGGEVSLARATELVREDRDRR
jgi:hypothetical protein